MWSNLCGMQDMANWEWTKTNTDVRHFTTRIDVQDFRHGMRKENPSTSQTKTFLLVQVVAPVIDAV